MITDHKNADATPASPSGNQTNPPPPGTGGANGAAAGGDGGQHPSNPSFHAKADELRKRNLRHAHAFLIILWCLLVFAFLIYGGVHLATTRYFLDPLASSQTNSYGMKKSSSSNIISGFQWKAMLAALRKDPVDAVQLDDAGRVIVMSDTDLKWAVGHDAAVAVETSLMEHTRRINDLRNRIVDQDFLEFRVKLGGGIGSPPLLSNLLFTVESDTSNNDFTMAAFHFSTIVTGWGEPTRQKVGEREIFELNYGLEQLAQLKREQEDLVKTNLSPPRMHQIFWTSPVGALSEAVFWSFIGTLVNLILNVSQARAEGRFRSDENWVSISKLAYGPVLSFILVLSIYFGVINAGNEVRFWLLPLLGFFFGYNTRKLAFAIDALSDKLFSSVTQSISTDAWQLKAATVAAENVKTASQPKTFDQLKQMTPAVTESAITAAVINQQNKQ